MEKKMDEEKLYRQFIKRKIIEMSTASINGIAKYLHVDQSKIYDKLYKAFAHPDKVDCSIKNDEILGQIYSDKKRGFVNPKTNKTTSRQGVPIYDYFDLDTLYSYYKFIEKIFKTNNGGKKYFHTIQDFENSLKSAKLMLVGNEGIQTSGYYDSKNPITCLTKTITMANGKNREVFAPEKTLSPTEFVKKFGNGLYVDCEDNLDAYMKDRYEKRMAKNGKKPFEPVLPKKEPEKPENIKIDPVTGQIHLF